MLDDLAQTLQDVIQALVTPDVTELKTLAVTLKMQLDQRFEAEQSDIQFKALMAALGEFKAQSELANLKVIASLSERVAVLEARHL